MRHMNGEAKKCLLNLTLICIKVWSDKDAAQYVLILPQIPKSKNSEATKSLTKVDRVQSMKLKVETEMQQKLSGGGGGCNASKELSGKAVTDYIMY